MILYRGQKYHVIGQCKSIGNGSKEYIIKNEKNILVVLASKCRRV